MAKVVCLAIFCLIHTFVFAQIKASFSPDKVQGCAPLTVHFTSTATGNVVNWYWSTSDGQTSTQPNPDFTFLKPGRIRIYLTVSNYTTSNYTYQDVVVNGIPTSFSYQYNTICSTPVSVQFRAYDTSAAGNYHWDFGDSSVSIETMPLHTYTKQGSYEVHLITYSTEGCIDSSVQPLQTGGVTVDFTAPASICSNSSVWFGSASSSLPKSSKWAVNGNVVSTSLTGFRYSFSDPRTYTIALTQDFGGCSFTKEKIVTVLQKPSALFTQTGTLQSCKYPSMVQFQNTSQYADNYRWNFGDSTLSSDVNTSHNYTFAGQFSPVLIATSPNGCADTLVKPNLVFIGPPIISGLQGFPSSRCLPDSIKTRAFITSPESVASYFWNFGNSTYSSDSMPTVAYSKQGSYSVSLIVKTISGCIDTFRLQDAVTVGDSVVPDFKVDRSVVCASDSVRFSASANKYVSTWYWTWEDGTRQTTNSATITHRFSTSGNQTVSLLVNNYGCYTTTIKHNIVFTKPPISYISVKYDCTNQLNVKFLDSSAGSLTWLWSFGDGTTSSQQNPSLHTYPASGIYTVKLTTTNGECSSTKNVTVPIINSKPIFTFSSVSTTLCRKQGVWMSATNPEYIADYYWNFDDGRSAFSDTAIYNFYNTPGTYHPSLITKYKNGCYDTIYSPTPVIINGPTAAFAVADGSTCLGKTTQFIDKTKSDGTHKLVSWWWSCGDGFAAKTNSDSPHFSHLYARSGNYAASMMIKDENNCADTAYYTVKINALPNVFVVKDTFVCDGNSVTLKAAGAVNYVWNTDPTLSCSQCDSTVALPQEESKVYVVTGTDANQCKASAIAHVQVVRPFNMSVSSTASEICQQQTVTLTATGADLYTWQPSANLSSATAANPIATPDLTTQYFVVGRDKYNCFSQRGDITIQVHPKPQFTIHDSLIIAQKGDVHPLATTGSDNITSWLWTPSYGLSCNDCAQPVVTAVKTTTYRGVASTDYGCTDTATIRVHVLCNQSKIYIPSGFSPNRDGKNDWFYVMSNIDNPIRSMIVYSRNGDRVFAKTNFVTNNPAQGWDGNVSGIPASEGVYVYRIEILCNDEVVPLTGTITLLR